jgi:hypothetical protein
MQAGSLMLNRMATTRSSAFKILGRPPSHCVNEEAEYAIVKTASRLLCIRLV